MKDKIIVTIKNSSIFLLMFMTIILMYTTILWIVKVPITKFHLPMEFIITVILFIAWQIFKINKKMKKENNSNKNSKVRSNIDYYLQRLLMLKEKYMILHQMEILTTNLLLEA